MEKTDSIKLLAIDDKPDNLTTLRAVVQDALPWARILTATNGPAGIELAVAEDPDVILLDIVMPGMDGFEVCRRLKDDDRIKDIPVVFLTALRTDTASRVKALEAGGEGFLAKPLETAELTAQIRSMTKVKAANRSQRTEKTRLEALVAERTADLRESESKYRAMFENMASASCVNKIVYEDGRAVDYRVLDVNPAYERITGISRKEAVGALASVLYGIGQAPFLDAYSRVAETGEPTEFEAWLEPMQKHLHVTVGCPKPGFFSTVLTDITERKRAEQGLRESEERFRILLENIETVAIQGYGLDGTIQYWNKGSEKLYGYRQQEAIGGNLLDLIIPSEMREAVAKEMRRMAESGRPLPPEELLLKHKDGSRVPVISSHTLVRVSGRAHELFCIDVDISERKQAEDALRASKELLTETERIGKVGGWSFNIDTLTQVWTDEVYRIHETAISPDPTVEQGINYYTQESRPIIEQAVHRAIAHGEAFDFELEIITAKGNTRAVHTIGKADLPNRRIYGFFQDITERKQAESELRRLSTAIRQSPETVVITDTAGTIQYVNPAFERTTGYTRAEALGQNPRILNSGRHDAEFYRVMWNTLQEGRVWQGRMVNKRKDGSLYTEDASIAPVKDNDGTITNYVAVKRDITAELAREEMLSQAQKMESVGRLAGGVAHDFNNLLMGIMGYAELCREQLPVDHPVREWVGEIIREAERSANLTRQLLAFARKQTVAPQVIDLNDAVGNMLKMLRRLIGEDIDLVWQPGANVWPLKIDPGQVDQILANLCVNARDAIGGDGRITIETDIVSIDADYCEEHAEAAPGSYVLLTVSDDGCGMDRETLQHVFEPFFTTKPTGEGTGLGLATVYGIAKQNNGFVNVYSEPGEGTTFRIYLPRDTSVARDAAEAAPKTAIRNGTETILLVEDETAIRTIMQLVLAKLGYTVIPAASPAEALRLAEAHRDGIDLMITDVVMPGMNGRALAEQLAPDFPKMKVLYMSGYTADVVAQRGILDEGVHFLGKPVGRDALAQKVREVLG